MPLSRHPKRSSQHATSGLGQIFSSPVKPRDKKKSTTLVMPLGLTAKQRALEEQQAMLMAKIYGPVHSTNFTGSSVDSPVPVDCTLSPELPGSSSSTWEADEVQNYGDDGQVTPDMTEPTHPELNSPETPTGKIHTPKTRRLHPDSTAHELYARWKQALPRLVDPLLTYVSTSIGREHYILKEPAAVCNNPGSCGQKSNKILCLFFSCKCILQNTFLLFTVTHFRLQNSQYC